jgi:hypothetical protein
MLFDEADASVRQTERFDHSRKRSRLLPAMGIVEKLTREWRSPVVHYADELSPGEVGRRPNFGHEPQSGAVEGRLYDEVLIVKDTDDNDHQTVLHKLTIQLRMLDLMSGGPTGIQIRC